MLTPQDSTRRICRALNGRCIDPRWILSIAIGTGRLWVSVVVGIGQRSVSSCASLPPYRVGPPVRPTRPRMVAGRHDFSRIGRENNCPRHHLGPFAAVARFGRIMAGPGFARVAARDPTRGLSAASDDTPIVALGRVVGDIGPHIRRGRHGRVGTEYSGCDDTALATVVVDAILDPVAEWHQSNTQETAATPTDPDFRAILSAWPGLSPAHRRLVRTVTEALPNEP